MASYADRIDGFQRRHTVVGFPLGVTYKFFDDQSNYLAATITYYAFASVVPLLLISSSVFGFLLQGNPELKQKALDSTVSQFPIVGQQLSSTEGIQGNAWVVVVGSLVALYGILGLGNAAQNAVHVAWAIPRNSRPNPFLSRLYSAVLLMLAGLVVIVVATLTSLVSGAAEIFGARLDTGLRWGIDLVSVLLTAVVLTTLMRLAMQRSEKWLHLFPGSLVTALLWQVLQRAGGAYVKHILNRADDLTAAFAVPLGLLALLYIAINMAMVGLQINVVLTRRLWPRALLTPFTDNVSLTDADRRAYAAYAKAQRHKGFETVQVTFDKEVERPGDAATQSGEQPQAEQGSGLGGAAEEREEPSTSRI
ncbi:YihY/virulence factor BrkB family protein [Nocardioides mangrovicus]|uniref:YihY/virulence factor BrkB family protein n=1 Tax=Nocardioides mangrovicus TaxID=2478913 RepID=A0A3L8NYG6_9ACTN|nr:YihY/virulence factor BrkB family protein [Nocardioides mangrovicus]RLV48205.1 YihY/virulence factor BrkB family protein [Nocardioides mangrovicus]